MKRVFGVDVLKCQSCGKAMKVSSTLSDLGHSLQELIVNKTCLFPKQFVLITQDELVASKKVRDNLIRM